MPYELFYGTGGHGGPYPSIEAAVEGAERMLAGSATERQIRVVDRETNKTARVVTKGEQSSICQPLIRAISPLLHQYPGTKTHLLAALETMPYPALRDLLNVLQNAEQETNAARRKLAQFGRMF